MKNGISKILNLLNLYSTEATEEALKHCSPFTKCINNTDGTTIEDTEDLNLVMLMYNLSE